MRIFLAGMLLACAGHALAGLGGPPANLGSEISDSKAATVSTGQASYTQLTKTLQSGTTLQEYVAGNGKVFAVRWSGPYLPDLREILGGHFDTLVAESKARTGRGRSALAIRRDDVTIISGGHMGSFEGKAWIPGSLPAGFTPDDIR